MSLENRAENALTGIVLLDIFQMLSAREAVKRSLPKGSLFIANETIKNLQQCAMGTIAIALSKDDLGNPWCRGDHRLDELPIEQHFGRLRSQSPTAQLSVRSFWQASARDMMKASREKRPPAAFRPPQEDMKPLTPDEFYACSDRAYRAAIRLASFCQGAEPMSVQEMYEEWCGENKFMDLEEAPLLGDEDEFHDWELVNQDLPQTPKDFLEGLQTEAAMFEDPPDDRAPASGKPDLDLELAGVPCHDELREILAARPSKQDKNEVPPQSPDKGVCSTGLAMNLHHSLWGLGPNASEDETFDSIWRLTMYLRHWQGGCDAGYIKDARVCRRQAHTLNWYQCLGICLLPFSIL